MRRIQNQRVLRASFGQGFLASLSGSPQIVEGTVRAIDLDKKRLRIAQADGTQAALSLPSHFSSEVLAPLLNRQVIITQVQPPRGKRLQVADIEIKPPHG